MAHSVHTRVGSDTRLPTKWMEGAACLEEDPELFFPIGETGPSVLQTEEAKAVCARCRMPMKCLERALILHASDGVWGGMDPRERRAYVRRMNRAKGREA